MYKRRLEAGVARELARKDLPLSTYTVAFWKIDLHNLFHFLYLRMSDHAQYEIRQYAKALAGIVEHWCPMAYKAFVDYKLCAVTFSRMELRVLEKYFCTCTTARTIKRGCVQAGMTAREIEEFKTKLEGLKVWG